MTSKGTVIKADGDYITVAVKRFSACDTCRAQCSGHCDKPTVVETSVKNTLGAKVGDKVELYSKASSVLTSAFVFFILPLVLTVAGYFIPTIFSLSVKVSIISSFFSFFISYFFIWLAYKDKKASDNISLLRIIED